MYHLGWQGRDGVHVLGVASVAVACRGACACVVAHAIGVCALESCVRRLHAPGRAKPRTLAAPYKAHVSLFVLFPLKGWFP